MRDQGQERRAAETSEKREERLQRMRDQEHEPLRNTIDYNVCKRVGKDNWFIQKLLFLISLMSELKCLNFIGQKPLCLTCLESFPGLTVSSDECSRFHRDSYDLSKLYSDANNMDTWICIVTRRTPSPHQLIIGRVHRSTNFRAVIEARQL